MPVKSDQQILDEADDWDTVVNEEHNWWRIGWIAAEKNADKAAEGAAENTQKAATEASGKGVASGFTSHPGRVKILSTTWEFKCKGMTLTAEKLKDEIAWAKGEYGWLPEGGHGTTKNVKEHWDKSGQDLTWEGNMA